jgi:hypothetical protein
VIVNPSILKIQINIVLVILEYELKYNNMVFNMFMAKNIASPR